MTNKTPQKALIKKLIKELESKNGFGKVGCYPVVLDCGNCRGQLLIGLLYWYLELLTDNEFNFTDG